MSGTEKSGLIRAVEARAGEVSGEKPAQGDNELTQGAFDIFADQPLLGELVNDAGGKRTTVGRPKGSPNKKTQEWADYILSQHRSPLIGLAEVVSTPIPQLATAMHCKRIEAAEFWRKCATDLAKYLHQAQPVAVALEGANAGMLTIVNLSAPAAGHEQAASAFGLNMKLVEEIEQNQRVSDSDNHSSCDDTQSEDS